MGKLFAEIQDRGQMIKQFLIMEPILMMRKRSNDLILMLLILMLTTDDDNVEYG